MDILILTQGILYFCMLIAGLAVSITTGVNRSRFNGQCILYGTFTEYRVLRSSAASTCDYPIYLSVVGLVLYGFAMGIYHMYCFRKSRQDPNMGFQMFVMPVILVDGILFVFLLVAACIVSVGYSVFCSNFLEGLPADVKCSVGENRQWHMVGTGESFNPGNYVTFMNSCMIFAWLGMLFLLLQIALGIFRLHRNRHQGRRRSASTPVEKPEY